MKDALTYGLTNMKKTITSAHPLESVLQQDAARKQQIDMKILRSTQGLHAGLRLHMERSAAQKVGHLPFLHRHNAFHDALTGNDMLIDFDDVLNDPADSEVMGQPHAIIEKQLGIL
nr:EOG090X0J8E [Eulimnadia texana]